MLCLLIGHMVLCSRVQWLCHLLLVVMNSFHNSLLKQSFSPLKVMKRNSRLTMRRNKLSKLRAESESSFALEDFCLKLKEITTKMFLLW